jgi:manganese efflux pump family protein
MGLAALIAWLLTASIGAYMLRTWVARGGLRRQRATGVGVPPAVVFGHAGVALTGLGVWISYLATGWRLLAWVGVTLVCTAICLGICTVTLWTPYPVLADPVLADPAPGGVRVAGAPAAAGEPHDAFTVTDEMIASLLAEPVPTPRRSRRHLLPLIPLVHGLGALTTFLLTVTAALLPVR